MLKVSGSLRFMKRKMTKASASPKNIVVACMLRGVLACRGGRNICRIAPRRPSAYFGTCKLSGERNTDGIDGA
jgi:hypothetical protein